MLYLLQTYIQEDVVFIQSVRISRGTGNQSTTDVTAVCGHAENTSERREKEVQVSPGPPECGLRSFISTLRLDPLRKTQPGCTERCLESRNARKRPACVCPCSRPRFDCYFCDIRASASNSCQIASDPAPTGDRAIGYFGHKVRGRTRDYRGRNTHHCHDHGLCPDNAIAVLVPIPIAVSIPIAILIAMVLIITVVAAMITIAAAVIVVLISFGLIITVLRGGRSY